MYRKAKKMNLLKVEQLKNEITIEFDSSITTITCLYLRNEFDEIKFEPLEDTNKFILDLRQALQVFKKYEQDKIYLILEQNNGILLNQMKINVKKFETIMTDLTDVKDEETAIYPWITVNGFFQFFIGDELPATNYIARRHIDKMKINEEQVRMTGKFSLRNVNLDVSSLVITSRLANNAKIIPLNATFFSKSKKTNTKVYAFDIDIIESLRDFMTNDFDPEDVIDIFIQAKTVELREPVRVKLGNPRVIVERFLRGEVSKKIENQVKSVTPYFTLKGRNLSFKINAYTTESYEAYLKSMKRSSNLFVRNKKKIWVVGEKYYKAQDNGLHFFKYMRTHHPEEKVYYVIDRNSSELKNVAPFGNIIYYQSPEHFDIMLKADFICSTHHPEQIYPIDSYRYTKKIKAKKVFLQHGVLGLKNLSQIYGKQLKDFNIDLFITSSEREKQIVERDLGYDNYQIKVTGLPRFDNLFTEKRETKDQILIIPTWRDWLSNIELLQASEYLERYTELLAHPKIKALAEAGTTIVFCLHPNMQPFIQYFDVPAHIKVIKQGEENVQDLIKESKLMITDYSSVAFDFSFMHKPVIYYQFDRDRFIGKYPSHLDIEKELPGRIVSDEVSLIDALTAFESNDFEMGKELMIKADKFNQYQDQSNSKRIFEAALAFKKKNRIKDMVQYDVLAQRVFLRFRKSKYYFKAMQLYNKWLVTFGRLDDKLIVFESNVGKAVADSPKVIYEVLKNKQAGYKIVWVNNNIYPFDDPNVISVDRLSPSYYKYLSKAKYWVNNQNFPYYIRKKRKTEYIQTWHGTPLKKMLNDVDTFEGKDDGYKDRVNIATRKWDYLISPSPYATQCFQSAFQYKKEILEVGYPRNDIFYNISVEELHNKEALIKQKLSLPADKKVILYAPTFRDDEVNQANKHLINLKMDLFKMKEAFGNEYVLLLRPHIIISNALVLDSSLDSFVKNVASYDDISDLYLISDICITDYSSVMFDFANTKRPLLFFTYDFEHYKNNLRGFYMDFEEEAPGPLLFNNQQLISAIQNIEAIETEYQDKYAAFYNKYCAFENGHAAEQVVEKVIGK
ncbi:CDP-glycerol:poly(glycerophosphate) glycerophosphotransferase [Listeria grayi]|nr:CDP-glycerol:poly(glycerophosphate) glycerophosphotransferase [Listeria grayi]